MPSQQLWRMKKRYSAAATDGLKSPSLRGWQQLFYGRLQFSHSVSEVLAMQRMLNADNNCPPIVSIVPRVVSGERLCCCSLTSLLIVLALALFIAPMMDAVEYEKVQFENAFHQKSRYRGSPTPELEQAWLDLWNCELDIPACYKFHVGPRLSEDTVGAINVPYDKLGELNKSEEVSWKRVSPEHGGGVSALIEVFHQIHCLVRPCRRAPAYWFEYSFFPDRILSANTPIAMSTTTAT